MRTLLTSLLAVPLMAASVEYTWDGSSTAYGDHLSVTYDGAGKVTKIESSLPNGDTAKFVGGEAQFAAGASVKFTDVGSLEFANPVKTLGDLTLESTAVDQTIAGGSYFRVSSNVVVQMGSTLDEVKVKSAKISYVYNKVLQNLDCTLFHEKREDDAYTVQVQNWNGAWTRCIKIALMETPGGIVCSNVYARQSKTEGLNVIGADFDTYAPYSDVSAALFLTSVQLKTEPNLVRRQAKFSGSFDLGGKLTTSKGMHCIMTGEAIGAFDANECKLDLNFDNGSFTFLDCGQFTQVGNVTGTKGRLIYASSDTEPAASQRVFLGPISTNDQVVLENASLTSLTGVSAVVRWQKYDDVSKEQVMFDEYRGDLQAAMFRPMGQETAVRFQARAGKMAYSTGVRFRQDGSNVVAKVVSVLDVWIEDQPSAADPWTWDHVNDLGKGASVRTLDAGKYTAVSNLTFQFASPADAKTHDMDLTIAYTDSTTSVSYEFRPGTNRLMSAVVNSHYGVPRMNGEMHVYDRAILSLAYPGVSSEYGPTYKGLWPDLTSGAAALYVHPGGRMITNAERQNSGFGQVIHVDGAKYAFHAPADTSYLFGRDAFIADCIGDIEYSNGAVTDGYSPYLGKMSANNTIKVSGSKPSVCKNGFALYGSREGSDPKVCTLDVEDVTGDDGVDFTMEGRCYAINYNGARVTKTGAGTVLLKRAFSTPWHPFTISQGTVLLGIVTESGSYPSKYKNGCKLGTVGVSLEGGNLAVQSCITNVVDGPLSLKADGAIALGDGSKLTIADSSAETWADGALLRISGDPAKCELTFGSNAALTAEQLRKIRWNGMRVKLDAAGKLCPFEYGTAVLVR